MGMGSTNVLSDHVHPNLVEPSGHVCEAIDAFGGAIEKLLIKHGKHIIHEQFLLKRIGDATIDIYAMVSVLSKCTMSLNQGSVSARHEELMTKVIFNSYYKFTLPKALNDFLRSSIPYQNCSKRLAAALYHMCYVS
jgi:hypothetical protein